MKKSILLVAVLMALVSLCLVFASCDSGSSDSSDPVTYTVSFNANGGSGTMNPSEPLEAGTIYKIPANGFTEPAGGELPVGAIGSTDKYFAGWNTQADGEGTWYNVGEIKTITGNTTLYAIWGYGFRVAENKWVYFSKGNLQATIDETGVPTAWKFAENQFDCIGANKANTTIGSVAGDIDLFGWSTEATNYGINTSTNDSDYSEDFKDWGKAIGDGNTWRTLSNEEWSYLLNTRDSASSLKKCGVTVCGKDNCLILAPDNFTETIADSYDATAWSAAEAAGLVCLPAAGFRFGSSVDFVVSNGYYWSATPIDVDGAYYLCFNSSNADMYDNGRYFGRSVRLVCGEN